MNYVKIISIYILSIHIYIVVLHCNKNRILLWFNFYTTATQYTRPACYLKTKNLFKKFCIFLLMRTKNQSNKNRW